MASRSFTRTAFERSIVRTTMRILNDIPGIVCRKLHGSGYTVAGDPDIYGCYNGQMFLFEAKAPGGYPTKAQKYRLQEWAAAGAITGIIRGADDALRLLGLEIGDVRRGQASSDVQGTSPEDRLAARRLVKVRLKSIGKDKAANFKRCTPEVDPNDDEMHIYIRCPHCHQMTKLVDFYMTKKTYNYTLECYKCFGMFVIDVEGVLDFQAYR